MPLMALSQVLFTQGFGVRRACEGLVAGGHVRVGGTLLTDPGARVETEGLRFEVEVFVNGPNAAMLCHGNGKVEFSDSIHGSG